VVPAALTAGARLEEHLVSALHQLWKSALIVEQGVAQPASSSAAALDPTLERLMGMAQPRMSHADITNQNLQRQMSAPPAANSSATRSVSSDASWQDMQDESVDLTSL
jgi:hypothetical protein